MSVPDLLDRWAATLPGHDAVGLELIRRWSEPHRAYHDLRHLAAVLEAVDLLSDEADNPTRVRLAAWFHDAVYDPAADDNEEQSALLATQLLGDAEVARLVRLTATHDPAPDDRNGRVLCDADLSVLGSAPARYDTYAADVRREYAHVPDPGFAAGRAAILDSFLDRDRIYHTEVAGRLWEQQARENLARERQSLG